MTVNVPIWAGLLYSIFLLGSGFGGAFAALRNGARRAEAETRDAQKDAIDAMQAQINSQKDLIQQQANQLIQHETKIEALEKANRLLTDLLQGRPEWAVISKSLETINNVAAMAPQWREEAERREEKILDALNTLLAR